MTEAYTDGGDTIVWISSTHWEGQTFHPTQDHTLLYIDLEMQGLIHRIEPTIEVYRADAFHKPFGASLSRNRYMTETHAQLFTPGRVRFSMIPVKLNAGEYYVILIEAFPALPPPLYWVQYNAGDGAYPRGLRISSDNAGVDWTAQFGDDFMFAEFGEPHSPNTTIAPVINNFFPTDFTVSPFTGGACVTFITNVPSHLTFYWTDKLPQKHHTSRKLRGLDVPWYTYFCFVAYHAVEQDQPGDTLIHTFRLCGWPIGQRRWFTIRGDVDTVLSSSVGPIFNYKLAAPEDILNPSFEDWDAPGWNPDHWALFFICAWGGTAYRSTQHVKDGEYSVECKAVGPSRCVGRQQTIDATPYRFQTLNFRVWVNGFNGPFCFFQVDVDGTGGWMQRAQVTLLSTDEHLSIVGLIPGDATQIRLAVHTGTGILGGPVYNYFDLVTIECP